MSAGLIVGIILANLADALSTVYGLRHGLEEINPLIVRFGLWPVKILATCIHLAVVNYLFTGPWQMFAAGVLMVLFFGVAAQNLLQVWWHS